MVIRNMSLKDAELESEAELEEILINQANLIDDGFKILRAQRRTAPVSF